MANTKNLEASITTLDQEKAFDRVDRKFLLKTLKKFGYGPKMISIIEALYNNIEAQIKINGNLSQSFPIDRSETGLPAIDDTIYYSCRSNNNKYEK